MFFWLYAIIELLAIFLDSGIIPTANASYPVSALEHIRTCSDSFVVVRWSLYWSGRGGVLLYSYQWICRVPIRGGWDTAFIMGTLLTLTPPYPLGLIYPSTDVAPTDILLCCLCCGLLRCDCHIQTYRRL